MNLILRTWISAGAGVALLLFSGCGGQPSGKTGISDERITNVKVMELELTAIDEYTSLSGTVKPWKEALVSSEEGGTVENLYFDKGDFVKTETILAEIDMSMLKAILEETQADLELRNAGFRKSKILHEQKSITDMEMLQAKTARDGAQARTDQAQVRFERASVKAPVKGYITEKYIEKGELTAPGTPVARIEDITEVKIVTEIAERDIPFFREGNPAGIKTDAYGDRLFSGEICYISPSADNTSRTFAVEIRVENRDGSLRPGMICDVSLLKCRYENVVVIPIDSIMDSEKGKFVFLLDNEGKALQRFLVPSAFTGDSAVISEGLSAGEKLLIEGHRELAPGEKLRVTG